MKKKYLSILLILVMVFAILPDTPATVRAVGDPVAQIDDQEYNTLQDAVNAIDTTTTAMPTIELLRDISLSDGVVASTGKDFTIDLNGKTVNDENLSSSQDVISHYGSGTLIIKDSMGNGKITANRTDNYVISTGYSGGNVSIEGGTIQNYGGTAVYNANGDMVSVSGGAKVIGTGNDRSAIYNQNGGTVSMSDNATLQGDFGVYNHAGSVSISLSGNTAVVASGTAIFYNSGAAGTIDITSGTVTVSGNTAAMNKAPDLSRYTNVQITASTTKTDGTETSEIESSALNSTNIGTYKYLKFEASTKITSQLSFSGDNSQDCTNTTKHTQHTHADGRKCWAWDKDSATLTLDGVNIEVSGADSAIDFESSSNTKLVLKGNSTVTLKDSADSFPSTIHVRNDLEISGTGALTINGSNKTSGTSRTVSSGIYTNGKLKITSGTITAVGGTVSTTGTSDSAGSESYGLWGYGGVEITGGTVNATGGNVVFENYGNSRGINYGPVGISLLGGTVTAQAMIGHRPFHSTPSLTGMVHRAGTGAWDNTSGTACTYEPGPPFVAVNDIAMTNAASVQVNTALTLAGTVTPSDATNKTIVWSVQNADGTGATISGSTFRATTAGTATIRATVVNGASESSNYTKDFTISVSPSTPPFVAVGDITMTNAASVQVNTDLTLAGTVTPSSATNMTIVWSVHNAGGTGATISGSTFRAMATGTATVKATVTNGSGTSSDYIKTFDITVNTPPTNNGGSGGSGGGAGIPIKNEGEIEKVQKQEGNAPTANLKDSIEDLKAKVLSAGEQEQVAAGKDAKIILKVQDISSTVSAEDKKRIEEKLVAEQQSSDNPVLLYVDISLYKQVGDGQETKVTETSSKIMISIEVPESMWSTEAGANRTYRVVRIHNGMTELLGGTYDPETHLFTFETDRFSTYALTYQDSSKQDSSSIQTYQDFYHLQLTAKAKKTSQTLSYKNIADMDGYLIYGAKCGEKMTELAKVPAGTTSYTVKNLKQGTYYKYQVKAYRIIDGEQVIIMSSKVIHSVTEGKTYANPTKVTSDIASVKLAVGKSKIVTCQVVLPKGKKMKEHTATIRYESSNNAIVTVNSKGKITAKAKGSCYVYAYAQNGVYKKIKITV